METTPPQPDAAPQMPSESVDIAGLLPWVLLAVAVLASLFALRLLWRRRSGAKPPPLAPNLRIDVASLNATAPPIGGPRLELYHIPVRLGALVLAPTGRGAELPGNDKLPLLVDHIVPGLMDVLRSHQPRFERWPAQLSTQGFSTTLFSNLALPGDRGRGTPWCALSGRVEFEGQKYLVGMALCAQASNGLGQITVERETDWLDMLRVVQTNAWR